jgi:hypothetical protein
MKYFEKRLDEITSEFTEYVANNYNDLLLSNANDVQKLVEKTCVELMNLSDNNQEYALTYGFYFTSENFFQHSTNFTGKKLQAALLMTAFTWRKLLFSYINAPLHIVGSRINNPDFATQEPEIKAKLDLWIIGEMRNSAQMLGQTFPNLYQTLFNSID